jgi:superfamily II DNA or RNA helicase
MIEIVANAVDARLLNVDKGTALNIYNLLSYFVDGFEQSTAYKQHRWDGKASFFSLKTQAFPAGFLPLVSRRLNELGLQHNIRRKQAPAPLGPDLDGCQARTGFPYDPRYEYQHETVKRLLAYQQMIARVCTGGGKSAIAAMCFFKLQRPTLFLTTRQALAYQMKDNLERMGETVGIIGDSTWEPNLNGFTVAMAQSLAPKLKPFNDKAELDKLQKVPVLDKDGKIALDNKGRERWTYSKAFVNAKKSTKAWEQYQAGVQHQLTILRTQHNKLNEEIKNLLLKFEFVILEEAHESSADGYYTVMRHCKNAMYRLALTATPFVKDSEQANMRLMACSGPVGISVDEKTLIDRGILAKPYFKYVEAGLVRGLSSAYWQKAYSEGIVKNDERNTQIVREALAGVQHGLSVLILILRVEHGKDLTERLKKAGVRARFLYGSTDNNERQMALNALSDGTLQVMVASVVLDVGVDVPSLGMVILAGGGKAETSLRQRIGRGLRAKKQGANVCFIVDFIDKSNRHLHLHSEQRKAIIQSIDGFKENILPAGQDFDWSLLDPIQYAKAS